MKSEPRIAVTLPGGFRHFQAAICRWFLFAVHGVLSSTGLPRKTEQLRTIPPLGQSEKATCGHMNAYHDQNRGKCTSNLPVGL